MLAETEMINYVREIFKDVIWESTRSQCVSYDTQFNLGDFYVSSLAVRDPRRETRETGSIPIVPAFLVIHHKKFKWDHDLSLRVITSLVPELKKKMFVATSDDEFTSTMVKHFTKCFVGKDENHMTKK